MVRRFQLWEQDVSLGDRVSGRVRTRLGLAVVVAFGSLAGCGAGPFSSLAEGYTDPLEQNPPAPTTALLR